VVATARNRSQMATVQIRDAGGPGLDRAVLSGTHHRAGNPVARSQLLDNFTKFCYVRPPYPRQATTAAARFFTRGSAIFHDHRFGT
jgi:hypothetical protein